MQINENSLFGPNYYPGKIFLIRNQFTENASNPELKDVLLRKRQ